MCVGHLLTLIALLAAPLAVAAQPDEAGVRAAVRYANSPAVWSEALRQGDPTPLAAVWVGDPLGYFSGEVLMYRSRGLRILSHLDALDFRDVQVFDDGRASARTYERWHDLLCTVEGEFRAERTAEAEELYELLWRDDAWWVSGVEVTLAAGSFDWTDAVDPPAEPSPCAAVLATS